MYINQLPGNDGIAMGDFFTDLWGSAKDYGESLIGNVANKVQTDANNKVRELMGLPTGTPPMPEIPKPEPQPQVPAKEAVQIAVPTTSNNPWWAALQALTKETWDALPEEQKKKYREAASQIGYKIPFDTVTGKAKNFVSQYKDVIAAGAVAGLTYYFSKSMLATALSAAGGYLIMKNFVR